jgi:DNA-binding SARP family transcriptional activator
LARALFAFDRKDEASGLISLRSALALGKEGEYFGTWGPLPHDLVRLCMKALEYGIEVEYVQELIRRHNIIPDKPPFYLENWPWPLKIFTLGRFELIKDGNQIQFSRKVQQKPLAMLKALIALGGKGVREDQITDALWFEADGDMVQQSFSSALHRLRQLLGYERAIVRQEGKLTLEDKFCWVDLWAFEAILEEADGQWKKERVDKAIELTEKAIEMYKGPFLAKEIEQPWTISMRERLRSKFLRNVEKLGKYWQQSSQWERTLDCYLRGLEIDDLVEEFYFGLMTCYHYLDRKTDALAVYHRYKKTLSSLPGIESSAKIEALYKSLIAHRRTGESVSR